MDKNGRLIARIIGEVSLGFGIAAASLAVWTVGGVKLFAAIGPIWIAAWTWLVSFMDEPVSK